MRGAIASLAAHGRANSNRDGGLKRIHVIKLRDVADKLVKNIGDEITKHDFCITFRSHESHAGRNAHKASFADGRIENIKWEVRRQTFRHLEGTAVWIPDVFTNMERALFQSSSI